MSKKTKTSKPSKRIEWKSVRVAVDSINPTPKNYKIRTDLGKERLQQSLKAFGIAGNVVCNYAKKKGRYDLIDGNSRWEEEKDKGTKMMWISVPSRVLTPKEYQEMSAMFDFAKAGEVDTERINADLGTTKDWFDKWGIEMSFEDLEKMGSKANLRDLEYPEEGKGNVAKKKGKGGEDAEMVDTKLVQLFFTDKQEAEFRKIEEKAKKKFKINNTTDVVFKAMKLLKL